VAPLRIGIVGVGNIATLNVPGYLAHDDCEVVALCDPRQEVLDRRGSEWSVDRCYTSIDDLLADDAVDAVEILSPTPLHGDHVLAALAAGKHVSCQKPIANSVATGRRMADAAREAGLVFRVTEQCCHYPPLEKARALIRSGAIGRPTVVRIKTVVGRTDSSFQAELDRGVRVALQRRGPGGHLFDDVMHKYAMALWLVDEDIRSVQAVVRRGPLFFEAPTVALWEYARDDLLGMMEVSYAPDMYIRSHEYGADEFFEIQGTRGFIWVTRMCGKLHDLAPVVLYEEDGRRTTFADMDASYEGSFRRAAAHFVDSLRDGAEPELDPETAIRRYSSPFAVYQASNERRPVAPGDRRGGVTRRLAAEWRGSAARRRGDDGAGTSACGAARVVTPGATPACAHGSFASGPPARKQRRTTPARPDGSSLVEDVLDLVPDLVDGVFHLVLRGTRGAVDLAFALQVLVVGEVTRLARPLMSSVCRSLVPHRGPSDPRCSTLRPGETLSHLVRRMSASSVCNRSRVERACVATRHVSD
jgi:predicted dehydrogenase